MSEGFFEVGDHRLEWRRWGPRRGPTLVLLHEGLGAITTWRNFPARLSERTGAPVLAYARAGYGRSSPCALPRPLSYMHEEARAVLGPVLDSAGVETSVLVGHSDGGSIAALHAAQTPHPSVRGLVLVAPHFFVEDCSVAAIAETTRAFATTDLRSKLERHHGSNTDCAFRGWSGAWLDPAFRKWDLRPLIPAIELPARLIQGTADPYGTLAQVRAYEALAAGPASVVTLEGCGHAPHREAPEATLDAVTDFFTEAIGGS